MIGMRKPVQRLAELYGAGACYVSVALEIAEAAGGRPIDALRAFDSLLASGLVAENGYVLDAVALIEHLLPGTKWEVEKVGPEGRAQGPWEWEALLFARPGDRSRGEPEEVTHFVLGDRAGGIASDPYGQSRTVREGRLIGKRIFRKISG